MRMKQELYNILSADSKDTELAEERNTSLKGKPLEETLSYQRVAIDKMREEIEGLKQDREQRKVFGYCIFCFMCVYMAVVIALVACCGFGFVTFSDTVLITLLTSTLAEIIGIFNFVAKYLFHKKE